MAVAVLAAFAWLIAIAFAVVLVVLAGIVLWLRRGNPDDARAFAERAAALREANTHVPRQL